jgi:hypothetical protein
MVISAPVACLIEMLATHRSSRKWPRSSVISYRSGWIGGEKHWSTICVDVCRDKDPENRVNRSVE